MDIGTGSGILAIAAVKLGYRPVAGIDSDPDAIHIARANARKNRVKLPFHVDDVRQFQLNPRRRYGIVCANLTCDLLISERDRIIAQMNSNGALVLAGVLRSEFPEVRAAYKHCGLCLLHHRGEGTWQSAVFGFRS